MSRTPKRMLFVIGGAAGFLVLAAVAAGLLADLNRYKSRFEAAASTALGMNVHVGGRLGMGFFPGLHLTAGDVQVLGEQGAVVASVKRGNFRIELAPLFRKELRLSRVDLTQPRLSIERNSEGRLNVERLNGVAALFGTPNGVSVSLSGGTLLYADRRSGKGFEATDIGLDVHRMRFAGGESPQLLRGLSLNGALTCGELRTKDLLVSALKASVDGKDGIFTIDPITMSLFGGQAVAKLSADVSGSVPLYQVRCSLSRFRIEEFLKTLSPKTAAEGAMDFTASLTMHGTIGSSLTRTAAGEISLRSRHITLIGNDLDRVLSQFESSQNFSLVDVGAVFFAGPLGLAVTKGYNFASLFRGGGGNSSIETLVSEWKVERGVAHAKDVAMATSKNRIALRGDLDFVNQRFVDVTVAVVDGRGCALVRQAIRGSFANPVVEKPRALTSLAGPVLGLYRKTRGLFPSGPCEAFYSGAVAPPK